MAAKFEADREPLVTAAVEWYVRLRDGILTAAERKELMSWLQKPSHCRELMAIARMDGMVLGREMTGWHTRNRRRIH